MDERERVDEKRGERGAIEKEKERERERTKRGGVCQKL